MEIGRYVAECRILKAQQDRLIFCQQRDQVYVQLAAVALDLVLAPVSEAYCERVFTSVSVENSVMGSEAAYRRTLSAECS